MQADLEMGSADFVGRKEDSAALLPYRDVGREVTGRMPVPLS
jgi:hypothetical protein